MGTTTTLLVPTQAPVLNSNGTFTLPWLNFLSSIAATVPVTGGGVAGVATRRFAITGAPLEVHVDSAGADGQLLVVVVVQDSVGYPVTFDSTQFKLVPPNFVPTAKNTISVLVFAGNSEDGMYYLTPVLGRGV